MSKKISEALRIAPVPLNTIKDAGTAIRSLYPVLRSQAEVIRPSIVGGVVFLADSHTRRELVRPTLVEVASPLPEISRFGNMVMLGAATSADGQWINAPFFLNQPADAPEVVFGNNLTNYGVPGEYFVASSDERIVFRKPSTRLEDPDFVASSPPVGLMVHYPEVQSLVTGILDYEIAA